MLDLVLTAIWVIGDGARALWPARSFAFSKAQIAVSAVAVAATLFLVNIARQFSVANLSFVEQKFPVRAVNFVNVNQLPGPLFNDYDWGGFLLWGLARLPVAINRRLNLFGEDQLERSLNTWDGRPGWNSDPDITGAKLVIANKQRMLVSLLRYNPRFKIVYEDDVAVVFVALK